MGLFTKLFGGSRSKNESKNLNNDFLKAQLGGSVGTVGGATDAVSALLGFGGNTAGQSAAFNNYRDSAGYRFLLDEGMEDITGNAAARGLLRSGSTGEALTGFRTNLANTFLDNYIKNSLGVGQLGLGAAGILADTGKYSKGKSSQDTGNFGKFIGSFLSERHLKTNITKIGEMSDGLGVYEYEYKADPGTVYIGTMVDEVEQLRPWALGPVTDEGYRTVNYKEL